MTRAPPQFQDFAAVVADTFAVPVIRLGPATTAADVDGWDSISNATLVVAVEERFGVTFSDEEVGSFPNLGDMFARLSELAKP